MSRYSTVTCRCGRPAAPGRKTCQPELDVAKETQRRVARDRRKLGQCVACGEPATRGLESRYPMCDPHADRRNAHTKRYRERRGARDPAYKKAIKTLIAARHLRKNKIRRALRAYSTLVGICAFFAVPPPMRGGGAALERSLKKASKSMSRELSVKLLGSCR